MMGAFTSLPYRLVGGATRGDAISGMTSPFRSALGALYAAAPPDVQKELGLTSGYRSPERQRQLWEASDKSGHMVARPGHSHHNMGDAADLSGFGLNGQVSKATRDWVHQNAGNYGLYFPMGYEPWHIQLRDSTGKVAAAPQGQPPVPGIQPAPQQAAYHDPQQGPTQTGATLDASQAAADPASDTYNMPPGMTELEGKDKDKSLGGLIGEMMKQQSAPPPAMPQMQPMQGGASGNGNELAQYIQQYIQQQTRGAPAMQPPQGGQRFG